MGGSINLVIRENLGKVYAWEHWTNSLATLITNLAFCEGPDFHFNEWFQDDPDLDGVYPLDYGLVVIDMVTRRVLHMQEYTSDIGSMSVLLVGSEYRNFARLDPNSVWVPPAEMTDDTFDVVRLRDFVQAGRLKAVSRWNPKTEEPESFPVNEVLPEFSVSTVFEHVVRSMLACNSDDECNPYNRWYLGKFIFDMDPWTVTRFERSPEGAKAFHYRLDEMGFELDEARWQEWIGFLST